MTKRLISVVTLLAPVLALGTVSCSSMSQARVRLASWQEEREERRLAREVAAAEKEMADEAKRSGGAVEAPGLEDSIFLDYANPSGSLLEGALAGGGSGGYYGGGLLLPASELPELPDWPATGEAGAIFLDEAPPSAGLAAVGAGPIDVDLVRAWAASISPVMGASLTEPLITAAMTARMTPTETAVAEHAAVTDTLPLAQAFAGQPSRPRTGPFTSEFEHE